MQTNTASRNSTGQAGLNTRDTFVEQPLWEWCDGSRMTSCQHNASRFARRPIQPFNDNKLSYAVKRTKRVRSRCLSELFVRRTSDDSYRLSRLSRLWLFPWMASRSLHSLSRVLFNFPSRYLFAIGFVGIFSLRWNLPPFLTMQFQASRLYRKAVDLE